MDKTVCVAFVSTEYDSVFYGVFDSEDKVDEAVTDYLDANPDASARYWEVTVNDTEAPYWMRQ